MVGEHRQSEFCTATEFTPAWVYAVITAKKGPNDGETFCDLSVFYAEIQLFTEIVKLVFGK